MLSFGSRIERKSLYGVVKVEGNRTMLKTSSALLAIGLAASVLAPSAAGAKVKYRYHHHYTRAVVPQYPSRVVYYDPRPPLRVNQRSWLDPGPVAPADFGPRYMQASTVLNLDRPDKFYTDFGGNSLLPRRFDPPGKPEPIVEFWTPRGDW